mgnify:CR=1 FL=1
MKCVCGEEMMTGHICHALTLTDENKLIFTGAVLNTGIVPSDFCKFVSEMKSNSLFEITNAFHGAANVACAVRQLVSEVIDLRAEQFIKQRETADFIDGIRKKAARECIDIVIKNAVENPYYTVTDIKDKFGLEE